MLCHEVDYNILGEDLQTVEVELYPGETVIAEAGAMNSMEDGIEFEATLGDGSSPGQAVFDMLLSPGKRVLTGESVFMTHRGLQPRDRLRHPGRRLPAGWNRACPGTLSMERA